MKDNAFEEMQKVLSDIIGSLEPVPYEPTDVSEYETVTFDGTEKDNSKWKELVKTHTADAKTFEIHCWTEETDQIALALKYGSVKPMNWKYGTVIEGEVSPEFLDMLLGTPKPLDTSSGYNMMTPFFTVIFDNGFSSEHYGTENHIKSEQHDK